MPRDLEARKAQLAHDLHLVLRHQALGVTDVVFATVRLAGITIAPQVRQHDREMLRQGRCHLVPARLGLGMTMQQKQGRALAAHQGVDGGAGRGNRQFFEPGEHHVAWP